MISLDPGVLGFYLQPGLLSAPSSAPVALNPAALWLYLVGGLARIPAVPSLYFFVNITQSGFKDGNSPSSDTTLGGRA